MAFVTRHTDAPDTATIHLLRKTLGVHDRATIRHRHIFQNLKLTGVDIDF